MVGHGGLCYSHNEFELKLPKTKETLLSLPSSPCHILLEIVRNLHEEGSCSLESATEFHFLFSSKKGVVIKATEIK